MSLADPGDEYSELVPQSRSRVKKAMRGSKKLLLMLVIGIIIGIVVQIAFINPLINEAQNSGCSDCFQAKALLNAENECLYKLVPDVRAVEASCGTQVATVGQPDTNKGFTEEPA